MVKEEFAQTKEDRIVVWKRCVYQLWVILKSR